jgi:hypothetical protein
MSDPAIRAALEAACCDVFDRLRDVWPDEAGPPPDVMPMTAAAVAAFLRAPAINMELMLSGADEIAAAVERAARGGEGDA